MDENAFRELYVNKFIEHAIGVFKERATELIAPRTTLSKNESHAIAIAAVIGQRLVDGTMRQGNVYVQPNVDSKGNLYYHIAISSKDVEEGSSMPEGSRTVFVITNVDGQDTVTLVATEVVHFCTTPVRSIVLDINNIQQEDVHWMINHILVGDELDKSKPVFH